MSCQLIYEYNRELPLTNAIPKAIENIHLKSPQQRAGYHLVQSNRSFHLPGRQNQLVWRSSPSLLRRVLEPLRAMRPHSLANSLLFFEKTGDISLIFPVIYNPLTKTPLKEIKITHRSLQAFPGDLHRRRPEQSLKPTSLPMKTLHKF